MNQTRTDAHRPSGIVPANYEPVLAYNCGTTDNGWPIQSFGINCELDRRQQDQSGAILKNGEHNAPGDSMHGRCCTIAAHALARENGKQVFGSPGKCGSCGANFVYGDLIEAS